ncbi:class I SAM-dependent methyltransferase [Parvularcula sp. LCG005]|uniref:class I SAM-dependent methyltransferase n=1 Tax=Parvularcula sp. LCG005 TaxID=3078805 RepID=UPI002943076D|nr:class I SAM-dependent methyltransferase [Parvularcula sp. LCG005]WOI52849.1 class I SAM-dependent methyltransferase [Parvularcula sp. LCG005]
MSDDRLERERAFHNQRFAENERQAQLKYYAAVEAAMTHYRDRIAALALDADLLDYGCAEGDNVLRYASIARSIHGIDISDVAVDRGTARLDAAGITNGKLHVMNAEEMTFPDHSFDLVFGSGIVHHLDVQKSLTEIERVLKPGGRVLFVEPLGHNPAIDLYRRMTPQARTADEHPLRRSDFQLFEKIFSAARFDFHALTTLAVVPFRRTPAKAPILSATRAIDRALFRLPGLKWWAWYAVMEGQKAEA